MSIYLPNFSDQRIIDFCGAFGATVDGFYAKLGDLGFTGSIDDRWKAYLIDRYGYYNGPHVNGYEAEGSFEFTTPYSMTFMDNGGTGALRQTAALAPATIRQFAVCLWFHVDGSTGVARRLFGADFTVGALGQNFRFTKTNTNQIQFSYTNAQGDPITYTSTTFAPSSNPHLASLVWYGYGEVGGYPTGYIYADVDGVALIDSTESGTSTALANDATSTWSVMSAPTGTNYLDGKLGECTVWASSSATSELAALFPTYVNYNGGVPLDTSSAPVTPIFRIVGPAVAGVPTIGGSNPGTWTTVGTFT